MKGVIFDWGGVIMRTTDYSYRQAWDDRLGLRHGSVEQVAHGIPEWQELQHGQITKEEYQTAVAQRLNIPNDDVEQLLTDFYQGDQLNEEAIELIRTLARAEGVRLGLMSNNVFELRDEIESLDLTQYFDVIVISAEIGVMKPHPAAYEPAYQGVGLPAERCIFIDDSKLNVQGAEAVGMHAIHFTPSLKLKAAVMEWLAE